MCDSPRDLSLLRWASNQGLPRPPSFFPYPSRSACRLLPGFPILQSGIPRTGETARDLYNPLPDYCTNGLRWSGKIHFLSYHRGHTRLASNFPGDREAHVPKVMWCKMSSFCDDSTQEEYLRLQQPLGHRCGCCWEKQRQRWKPYTFPSALSSISFSFAVHTVGTNSRETYGCEGSHGTESREMWIQLEILEAPPRKLFVPTASSISNGKTSQRSAEVLPPLSAAGCISTGVLQEYRVCVSLGHKARPKQSYYCSAEQL